MGSCDCCSACFGGVLAKASSCTGSFGCFVAVATTLVAWPLGWARPSTKLPTMDQSVFVNCLRRCPDFV
eukprot:726173-Alexandrium_andersonii.AAC.1